MRSRTWFVGATSRSGRVPAASDLPSSCRRPQSLHGAALREMPRPDSQPLNEFNIFFCCFFTRNTLSGHR
jgi:hypothetical protein